MSFEKLKVVLHVKTGSIYIRVTTNNKLQKHKRNTRTLFTLIFLRQLLEYVGTIELPSLAL